MYLLHVSVPTILDLGDNSCGHSHKNHPCFSESSRQNHSGKSPLNQQCMNLLQTDTGGLPVRKKVCLIGLLHCKHDRYRFRGFFFSQFTTKFVLFFCFLLFSCEQTKKGGEKPNMCTIIREFCKFFLCCLFSFIRE